jgi:predicted RecB family nuclease
MASIDIASVFDRVADASTPTGVSPTDISQFIRLDQCQRFLRLQLHLRNHGESFLKDYNVSLQTIPQLLTRSGATFEASIEEDVRKRFPATRFDKQRRRELGLQHDNDAILQHVHALAPGETHILFQPLVQAHVGDWRLRGEIDILRLERDAQGGLHVLIVDMKSSTASRVEHRLQVAMYHEMIATLVKTAFSVPPSIELAILYRGPLDGTSAADTADPEVLLHQMDLARETFGTDGGYLEMINEKDAYLGSVRDLLTGPESVARRVLDLDFDSVPFHLTYKCDGCRFNEFCMKRSAETHDLSLLPHITEQEKTNLRKANVSRIQQLASLKTWDKATKSLATVSDHALKARELAVTWPTGQHLEELIHRAHAYDAWRFGRYPEPSYIPHKGYGSLPYSGEDLHPNLVRVYIDTQHDYLNDRIYMVGALVVASNNGKEEPARRRSIVRMTPVPPTSNEIERALLLDWIRETLRAIVKVAAPDENGEPRAPIHLIFVNRFAQKQLLNGLGRYFEEILGATSLYDFITQIPVFDSPIASFLDQEIREQKNYPMICQSLQSVATHLRFDWNKDVPYRQIFRGRLFDYRRKMDPLGDSESTDEGHGWYTGRARFSSQIPLEYAYAAWNELIPEHDPDALAFFETATPELMTGFHARRLEAMEHIAKDFRGNRQTQLSSFALPDLASFEQRAPTLAHALDEFVTIERFADLGAWKHARLAPPEQRVLAGESLIVRYVEADQDPGIAERNRDNQLRAPLREQFRAEYRAANPDAKQIRLPKEQQLASQWSHKEMRYRLRIETSSLECSLEDLLNLTTVKPGARMVFYPRWTTSSPEGSDPLPPYTPTAKQLLYGPRAQLIDIKVERDEENRAISAFAIVELMEGGGGDGMGFTFGYGKADPLVADEIYTLDEDPNDINGSWASTVAKGLIAHGENTLYDYLTGQPTSMPIVPSPEAAEAQQRFMDGLVALQEIGEMFPFEPSKHAFIGQHGDDPVLLVQGPPGTGKSYSTAWALLARIQGAMASGAPYRVALSCKTHAATDVLLRNVLAAQERLRELFHRHPDVMARYFDRRLCDVPLFRQRPKGDVPDGITPFSRTMKAKQVIADLTALPWSVVASTPGGIYSMVRGDGMFDTKFLDCVVLDEASQMNIPEAIMATLPLQPDGRLIVVGDHRQMPPIISHDWANEARRTFQEFRSYESLFLALLDREPPKISFERSFRLHADMAEFLRQEVYRHDGIRFHSERQDTLRPYPNPDPFIEAVLKPEHPLTVIVHDEVGSQQRNLYEQGLIAPVLRELANEETYGLTPEDGLGVVVPHRAQRAGLQEQVEELRRIDPETGAITISAVDTVERFQGDERTVIMIGATESDPEYLLMTGDFLLDPRRLTVALSRAKQKMILVASRSIFEIFSADEQTYQNAQMWKNLLRRTCTEKLWSGDRGGVPVTVWGNARNTALQRQE